MNVEKLHYLLATIKRDFDNHKIISKFSDFTWKMSQYVEDPSDENSSEFKATLDDLNSSLESFDSNLLVPTMDGMLAQLHASKLVGRGLRQSIERILSTNATEQADISQKLTDLLAEVNGFYERSADMLRAFSHFEIRQNKLEGEEFELGFIYPADQFDLTLAKYKNEIIFINKFLSDIYEVLGEQIPASDIRSMSSNNTGVYLRTPARIADQIMKLIKGIVGVYDTIGDIQEKTKELKSLDVSQNIIDLLKEEEKQRITVGLETLKADLINREGELSVDDGRMNELENSISIDLKQLAQKIEHGLKIEVSVPDALLANPGEIDGVNIRQLADMGRLMTGSAFTHEPVLLFAGDKSPVVNEQPEPEDAETDVESAIDPDDAPELEAEQKETEAKVARKKKSKVSAKKKKTEPNEDIPIDTNIEIDEEPEFGWVVTDD